MITACDISFRFGEHVVLAGVGLETRPGQITGLIGPNGSGKTTLLRCLSGSLTPNAGAVLLNGDELADMSAKTIAQAVAVVPQESTGGLGLTVADTVLLGRTPHRRDHQAFSALDREIVAGVLHQVGALHLAHRALRELSGGERQRVLIARCLAQQANILLLDEPTNHLDVRFQHEVLALVRSLELATVIVLHDLNLAARFCDHLVLLHEHRVVAHGSVNAVLDPNVLEPVYGITVRRMQDHDNRVHLVFG